VIFARHGAQGRAFLCHWRATARILKPPARSDDQPARIFEPRIERITTGLLTGFTGFFTRKIRKDMKAVRPRDMILDRAFAPFGSTADSVLEASFCAPVSSSPGCETEFPIVQNLSGRSKKLSSTLIRENMEGEWSISNFRLPVDLNRILLFFIFHHEMARSRSGGKATAFLIQPFKGLCKQACAARPDVWLRAERGSSRPTRTRRKLSPYDGTRRQELPKWIKLVEFSFFLSPFFIAQKLLLPFGEYYNRKLLKSKKIMIFKKVCPGGRVNGRRGSACENPEGFSCCDKLAGIGQLQY
jgi:hypothetical protein